MLFLAFYVISLFKFSNFLRRRAVYSYNYFFFKDSCKDLWNLTVETSFYQSLPLVLGIKYPFYLQPPICYQKMVSVKKAALESRVASLTLRCCEGLTSSLRPFAFFVLIGNKTKMAYFYLVQKNPCVDKKKRLF